MSEDMLSLGFDVDSRKVRTATDDVGKFGRAGTSAGTAVSKATGKMNTGFNGVALAAGAALTAMLSIGTAIRTIAEFESSVSRMGAISGATTADLERMRDVAKDLGSSTEFSATQAADGLTFLAMAGFEAAEAMAAIPAVLDLATASGMGLAQAADTASNIMSGFGIAAQNAANVADVLAAASSRSNTSVTQLGGAMSTVAPIAKALDISLADTAAAIGVMSDAGIQGERAGTAMRGVLASLAGPTTQATEVLTRLGLTIKDIDPAMNSLSTIMGRLGNAGLSTADAMTVFGREAASGALVLIDGAQRLGEFGDELRNVDGAAGDMAATMRDNLGGDIKTLQSAVSGLILALGEAGLTAILRGLVKLVTGVARAVTSMVDAFVSARDAVTGFVGDLFSVQSPAEKLAIGMQAAELAIDNSTIAMGDQIAQSASLASRLSDGNVITLESARVNLILAQARITDSEAAERQAEAQARTLLGADKAFTDVIGTTQALTEARNRLTAADIEGAAAYGDLYNSDTLSLVAELEAKLVRQLAAQKAINDALNAMDFLNPEQKAAQEQAAANIALLTPLIEEAQGNLISLNGEIVEGVTFSDRLGSNFDMYTGQLNSSTGAAGGLSGALSTAVGLSATLLRNLGMVPAALQGMTNRAAGMIQSMQETNVALNYQINEGLSSAAASIKAQGDAAIATAVANGVNIQSIAAMSSAYDEMVAEAESLSVAEGKLTTTLNDATDATKGAGAATVDTTDAMQDQISALEDIADPMRVFNREMEELDKLMATGKLSDGAYSLAVEELADRLRDAEGAADGFAGTLRDGMEDSLDYMLNGMKNGMDGLMDIFKSSLISMIKYAIMNPINLQGGMNMAGGSGGGMLSSIIGGGGAAGGGLLSTIGMGGGIAGSFMAGGAGLLTSLTGAGGGLAAAGTYMSAVTAGATASMGSFAAAAGAIALPLLAVAAVFTFFKKSTKELDSGLRITADSFATYVDDFKKIETSRFFGLSKKQNTDYTPSEMTNPIVKAIDAIKDQTMELGSVLGLSADNFASFSSQIQISLKGLSDDQAEAEIARAFGVIAEQFSYAALGHFQETYGGVIREGETAAEAMSSLAGSLQGVNAVMGQLSLSTSEASIAGAVAARNFADLFGGLDALNQVATSYYQSFYSDAERLGNATDLLADQMGALQLTVPATKDAFRALVDAADAAGNRELVASLLQLSPLFAQVADAAGGAAGAQDALTSALTAYGQAVGREITRLQTDATTALEPLLAGIATAEAGANDARSAFDGAMSSLRSFVESQIRSANDAAEAAIAPLQAELEALQGGAENASEALDGAMSSLTDFVAAQIAMAESTAEAAIAPLQAEIDTLATSAEGAAERLKSAFAQVETSIQNQVNSIGATSTAAISVLDDELSELQATADQTAGAVQGAFAALQQAIANDITGIEANLNVAIAGLTATAQAARDLADQSRSSFDSIYNSLIDGLDAQRSEVEAFYNDQINTITEAMDDAQVALTETADALNATAEAARNLANEARTSLDSTYSALTSSLDAQRDEVEAFYNGQINTLTEAFDAASEALQETVATLNETADAARDAADAARSSLDNIYRALTDSLDAQAEAVGDFYGDQIGGLSEALQSAGDASDGFIRALESIEGVLSSRGMSGAANDLMRYRDAQEQVRRFAAGEEYTPDQLSGALDGVSQPTEQFFGSRFDYEKDFAKTTASLNSLRDQAAGGVSEAEQQINILQVQLTTLEQMRDQALAAITAERDQATALYGSTVAILTGQNLVNGSLTALQDAASVALSTAQEASDIGADTTAQIATLNAQAEQQSAILQNQVAVLEQARDLQVTAIASESEQAVALYDATVAILTGQGDVVGTLAGLQAAAAVALSTSQEAMSVEQATSAQIATLNAQADQQIELQQAQIAALEQDRDLQLVAIAADREQAAALYAATNAILTGQGAGNATLAALQSSASQAIATAQNAAAIEANTDSQIVELRAQADQQIANLNAILEANNTNGGIAVGTNAAVNALAAAVAADMASQNALNARQTEITAEIAGLNESATSQIALLNEQLSTARDQYSAAIGIDSSISGVDASIVAMRDALSEYADVQAEYLSVLAENSESIAALESARDEQITALQDQLETAQATYDAATAQGVSLTSIDEGVAALNTALATYTEAQAALASGQIVITARIAEIEASRDAEIATLEAQLDTAQALYDNATGQSVTLTSIDAHMVGFNATLAEYTAAQVTLADITAINQPLIDSINATLAEQTGILEAQLASFQDQFTPLNDLPTALATLQAAIQALADAQAIAAVQAIPPVQEIPKSLLRQQLDAIYQRTLGRDADEGGAASYGRLVRSGASSLADVEDSIMASIEYMSNLQAASMGIPSYAVGTDNHAGGLAYVHQDELINMPSGSSVSTKSQTKSMLDNSELVAEVRALRIDMRSIQEENRTLQLQLVRYTRKTANISEQWNDDGLPAERTA
jgi:TP901 family phage tail tape measure protein